MSCQSLLCFAQPTAVTLPSTTQRFCATFYCKTEVTVKVKCKSEGVPVSLGALLDAADIVHRWEANEGFICNLVGCNARAEGVGV